MNRFRNFLSVSKLRRSVQGGAAQQAAGAVGRAGRHGAPLGVDHGQ